MELEYIRPSRMQDVLEALNKWGSKARILAGGTDLLVYMRHDGSYPNAIIDIGALEGLRQISRDDEYIQIGALVTHREIEQNPVLGKSARVLVSACHQIGSVQIRNLGTIGGNLANASPAGDAILGLYLLDSDVRLENINGERWVAIAEFIFGPGRTTLQENEIITAIRFKPVSEQSETFFKKVGQRRAVTISKVSVGGLIRLSGRIFSDCRMALGAVAPTVIRLTHVERFLAGQPATLEVINLVAEMASEACHPIDDIRSTIAYRRHMVKVLIRRGLSSVMTE